MWNQVPSLVLALFGSALTGYITGMWWPLIVFVVGCIALWGLGIETYLLCRHCPFYAEGGKTLHCWALDGWPKFWRYRPEPMNAFEKTILSLFFSFLVIFPVGAEAYGTWFVGANELGTYAFWGMVGITVATLMAGLQFVYIMHHDFCSRCVNFSCPLNNVPQSLVDGFLRKNPVMREAWERSGYEVSDPKSL